MDQLPSPALPGNKYATLSLSKTDRLRFLQFPEDVYQQAENVVLRAWPPVIQSASRYGGAHEYQLRGRPWGSFGKVEAIASRELLCSVLAYLYDRGWVLTTSIRLSEKVRSKDTLLFKKTGEDGGNNGNDNDDDDDDNDNDNNNKTRLSSSCTGTSLPPVDWLVVHFSHADRIYLHGSEAAGLIPGVRGLLIRLGLHEKGGWTHDTYKFCLRGTPWCRNGEESMQTRVLLLEMAEELDRQGWRSYGTIHQRADSDNWKVCDSWYLIRPRAAEAGGRSGSSASGGSCGIGSA